MSFFYLFVLPYQDISLIGTFEYLIAIPLFFISVLTMNTYSQLFHHKLDTEFDVLKYRKILRDFYFKALGVVLIFIAIQLAYIFFYKPELINYTPFLIFQSLVTVFTSLQGYILFFWRMNKMVITVSIFTLLMKNSLMLVLIYYSGVLGYFLATLAIDLFILFFIQFTVQTKVKQKLLNENSFFTQT